MAANAISAVIELTIIIQLYQSMQIYAMVAVVVAFAIGMYVTLEHSVGLAVTICFISCISFIIFCLLILLPVKDLHKT